MKERDLQRQVTDAASRLGWRYHHEGNSFGTRPGWPDLALFHPDYGALYVELKVGTYKVTAAQAEWLRWLYACGQVVAVIRDRGADLDLLYDLLAGDADAWMDVKTTYRGVYGLDWDRVAFLESEATP